MQRSLQSFIHTIKKENKGQEKKEEENDITCIIYNSSSSRMKSLGPKPMIKIYGEKRIIDFQIETIRKVLPSCELLLVVGEDADRINIPKGVRLIENQLHEQTNEAEYLRLAINAVTTRKAIFVNGDIIFNSDNILNMSKRELILIDTQDRLSKEEVGVVVEGKIATQLSIRLNNRWTNMFSVFDSNFDNFKKILNNKLRKKHFAFECINALLEYAKLEVEEANGKIYQIDSNKILELVKRNENINS